MKSGVCDRFIPGSLCVEQSLQTLLGPTHFAVVSTVVCTVVDWDCLSKDLFLEGFVRGWLARTTTVS